MNRPATRSDWKNTPMPEQPHRLKIERGYTTDEMELIRRGVVPQDIQQHWFMFFEQECLFCHRIWTGYCIYAVQFAQQGDGWVIRKAEVNRNPEQYQETNDAYDAEMLLFLIDRLLLRKDVPSPKRPYDTPANDAQRGWLDIGRDLYGGDKRA